MKRIFPIEKVLIVSSIGLLILLQTFWLNREYKSGKEAFGRETNLVFRTTIQQITDSLIFGNLEFSFNSDSTGKNDFKDFLDELQKGDQKAMRNIRRLRIEKNEDLNPLSTSDSISDNKIIKIITTETDTIIHVNQNRERGRRGNGQGAFRYILSLGIEEYDKDLLSFDFKANLESGIRKLKVVVLEKEAGEREIYHRTDSLPFTTSFLRLGNKKLYAINFPEGNRYVLSQILPQIGFSIILTVLVIVSFWFLLRNMRDQKKLLAQKNNFISNVSHELKTPVATVSVALEALQNFNTQNQPEKTKEYLEIAAHEIKRLGLMVEKILKTTVFDVEEEITLYKTKVNLSVLMQQTANAFLPLVEKNSTTLDCHIEPEVWVIGNEEHLELMIYNLIDNALKYGKDHGTVYLRLQNKEPMALLEFEDEGHGIAKEYQGKIFERFFRVPSGNVHDVKGHGLGLNYVAGVVRSHQGEIAVQSEIGKGTKFTIKLPING